MEKKRSVGVTIFALWGFVCLISSMAINPSKVNLSQILFSLVFILLSYNLFRLKNWSRIALFVINGITALIVLLSLIIIFIWLPLVNAKIQNIYFIASSRMLYSLRSQVPIWEKVSPYCPILTPILFVIYSVYIYSFVFFFSRPKVKALFSPERGKAESKEAV